MLIKNKAKVIGLAYKGILNYDQQREKHHQHHQKTSRDRTVSH